MLYRILLLCLVSLSLQAQTIEKAKKLFEESNYSEAKKLLIAVDAKQKEYADAKYYLGRIAFAEKKLDEAQEYLEEAIEVNNNVADYHFWLGNVMGSIAQDANKLKQGYLAPKIKNEFERTIQLDPKNISAHWGLIQFYSLAPGFMGGSWDKAKETAAKLSRLNKAEGFRANGYIFEAEEKFTEAEQAYILAYKEDSNLRGFLANFYLKRKEYDKAFLLFEEALEHNPDDMLSVYQLGKVSALSGKKLSEGEKALLRYLQYQPKQQEPSHAGAHMRLAQIKEKAGNKNEAKVYYQKALQQQNDLKEAKEGLERVSK